MTVELRTADAADVDAILAFWTLAAENAARPADTAAMIRALIARDPDALLVATSDEQILGTIITGWDGWRYHLYRLAVHPEHRGRGIARLLLSAAERRLARLGASRIDAMVLDGNDAAHGFWRQHGYTPQNDWSRWVKAVRP